MFYLEKMELLSFLPLSLENLKSYFGKNHSDITHKYTEGDKEAWISDRQQCVFGDQVLQH